MTYSTMDVSCVEGVILARIDQPERPVNLLGEALLDDLTRLLDRLAEEDARGLVLSSAKPGGFVAGADLDMLSALPDDTGAVTETIMRAQRLFRRLETGGLSARQIAQGARAKPVAMVLHGDVLGGGLELALAGHARFAPSNAKFSCGFPEVALGLIPGGGGTQRTPRLAGLSLAIDMIVGGRRLDAERAMKAGLINVLAPLAELESRATAWVKRTGETLQPWDLPGFQLPGGTGATVEGMQIMASASALVSARHRRRSPAAEQALSAIREGSLLPIDTGAAVEAKRFALCATSREARVMMRTLFHDRGELEKGAARPKEIPALPVRRIGVLGAGLMGSGITHVAARAGIDVVVIDRDAETAAQAVEYSRKALARSGRTDAALLARITPTADYTALAGVDLVIEAVFEDLALKQQLLKRAEEAAGPDAILASNTSTLPITDIAQALSRPDRFLGLHFFSPVEAMPLLEIIPGRRTAAEAIAMGYDFNRKIRKVPILVRDVRGFYTNRIVPAYLNEAMLMVKEGVAPALVENCALNLGMPMGPLAMIDEITLELVSSIYAANRKEQGADYVPNGIEEWLETLVQELNRRGKRHGGGFYDYPHDGRRRLWPGLTRICATLPEQPASAEVQQRLLYAQLVPAVRGITDKIVATRAEADLGAIFGWGFPGWTGGPISHVETIGVDRFSIIARELAHRHGERFMPPSDLTALTATLTV